MNGKPSQNWKGRAEARVKADPQLQPQADAILASCDSGGAYKFVALASTQTILDYMATEGEDL